MVIFVNNILLLLNTNIVSWNNVVLVTPTIKYGLIDILSRVLNFF